MSDDSAELKNPKVKDAGFRPPNLEKRSRDLFPADADVTNVIAYCEETKTSLSFASLTEALTFRQTKANEGSRYTVTWKSRRDSFAKES